MFILELAIALTVSLVLSAVFIVVTRRGGRRTGLFWLFLVIFLATWAGGIWVRPFGPTIWGIHWLTFLLVGVFIALILAIFIPRRPPSGRHETLDMLERVARERELERFTYVTLGIFFWVLLAALFVAIFTRYRL